MVQLIHANAEQHAIIKEVTALSARFDANAMLFHSASAIASAKSLISRAVAAGLDQRVFHSLQIWISLHETEQSMPEHLRSWHPRP